MTPAQAEKLAIIVHGTQTIPIDVEVGTYDSDVTTSSNRDVRSRSWSSSANGEGRYFIRPIPARTGGNVIIRIWNTIGVSGSAGLEVAWRLAGESLAIGQTLTASALPNSQTVYQDVSAQTAHVLTAFDITVDAALFDQTKRFAFILERLATTDARDDYTTGTYFMHDLEAIYTGWGITASPSAPA
jgi:hypothetical protein